MKKKRNEETTTIRIYKSDLPVIQRIQREMNCKSMPIVIRTWILAYFKVRGL